jgi:hypothetical protein
LQRYLDQDRVGVGGVVMRAYPNGLQGDIAASGQKRPAAAEVEIELYFAARLLKCVIMSQVLALLDDQECYEYYLSSDLSRVRLESNGLDAIYFSPSYFWPNYVSSEIEGKEHRYF